MKENIKAQASQYFYVVIYIMVFAIITLIGWVMLKEFMTVYVASGVGDSVGEELGNKYLSAINMFDYITLLMLIIFVIGIGITTYRLPTVRIAYIVTFLLSIFYGFISIFFNFFFSSFASQSVFNTAIVHFPKTIALCTNFHWIMLFMIIVGSLTLYARDEERGITQL